MNRSAAYDLFKEMRHSTLEEQQLYEKMLKNLSVPLGKDIMETEVDYCDICHKKKEVTRQYYSYNIDCDCCGGMYHFEVVKTCQDCEPRPPKWIHAKVKPIGSK